MAKQKSSIQSNSKIIQGVDTQKLGGIMPSTWAIGFIGLVAIAFYFNTLWNGFVMDDAIVITDNQFTQQGLNGLKGIFGYDTFFGFFKEEGKSHLVAGGRYRPLTLAMFAVEGQLFGFKPSIFHFFNILYFALSCMLLFAVVRKCFRDSQSGLIIGFLTAVLFAVHPIHTEVVANIKGRDEIICMIGGLLAMWWAFKTVDTKQIKWIWLSGVALFGSLLAKENGAVFLVLIPAALWFFRALRIIELAKNLWPLVLFSGLYIAIRISVLGFSSDGSVTMELMNNPFLKWQDTGYVPVGNDIRYATVAVTLLKYLGLLLFPMVLSSDYYPTQIPLVDWSNGTAILSALVYVVMIGVVLWRLTKKEAPVFGLIWYLVALLPVSNIFLPVGTLMSERFLYLPSVGFCIVAAWLANHFLIRDTLKSKWMFLIVGFMLLGGIKTIARNSDWTSNFTLFTTDVKVSDRSAKLLNSAGGALLDSAFKVSDATTKAGMIDLAKTYLKKAIEIHPAYANAYLLHGNAFMYSDDFPSAITQYEQALKYNPDFKDAKFNMAIAYREMGKMYGERKNDLVNAVLYLNKSLELNTDDTETLRLLGVASGIAGKPHDAVDYFERALKLAPDNALLMFDLGSAYGNVGDHMKANEFHRAAIAKDPQLEKRLIK